MTEPRTPRTEAGPMRDGPSVHRYGWRSPDEWDIPFTSWTLLRATDADGREHIFHVPTEALAAAPEAGALRDALRRIRELCDTDTETLRAEHGSEQRVLMAVIPSIVDAALAASPAPLDEAVYEVVLQTDEQYYTVATYAKREHAERLVTNGESLLWRWDAGPSHYPRFEIREHKLVTWSGEWSRQGFIDTLMDVIGDPEDYFINDEEEDET